MIIYYNEKGNSWMLSILYRVYKPGTARRDRLERLY